jgi:low affinity Fe/Cu permease
MAEASSGAAALAGRSTGAGGSGVGQSAVRQGPASADQSRRRPGAFSRFARFTSGVLGHPAAFSIAAASVAIWAALGPAFGYSEGWQLTINTGTTIVTFLMVFLIQNTQNRQGDAVQIKLDELIRAVEGAHTRLVDLENASDEELHQLRDRYHRLADTVRARVGRGAADTGRPDLEE